MIDNFALGLVHFLLIVMFWRLLVRRGLEQDPGPEDRDGGRP